MAQTPVRSSKLLLAGLSAAALGAMILLVASGVLPSKATDAPAWTGACAGLAFLLASGALLLRWVAGGGVEHGEMPKGAPFWSRAFYQLAGLICIGSLAAVGTWVGFGPGERTFSMSIPYLGKAANELIGRSAFGAGALLTWLFFFVAASNWWRKLSDSRNSASS
jgi:hypothetical protein